VPYHTAASTSTYCALNRTIQQPLLATQAPADASAAPLPSRAQCDIDVQEENFRGWRAAAAQQICSGRAQCIHASVDRERPLTTRERERERKREREREREREVIDEVKRAGQLMGVGRVLMSTAAVHWSEKSKFRSVSSGLSDAPWLNRRRPGSL
jgi:hypothetical protein